MATALLAACRTRLLTSTRTTSLFSSYQTRLFCSSSNGCSEARQEEKKSSHPSTASQGDSTNLHEKLCEATLAKVSEHGWTAIAIEAALDDLQLSPASASLLPAGIASVADYLDMSCNTRLARHLFSLEQYHHQKQQQPKPSTDTEANSENTEHESDANGKVDMFLEDAPTRAAYAMHYRLTLLDDYHQFWYQAVALRARLPREALRNRLLLADEIAAFANYNSPNMSWYTDRAVIGSIYQAAELYWLTDTSKDRKKTKDLISRRVDDAHGFRSKVSSSFSGIMAFYDAASATTTSLFRASRNSY